jgi:basic membrane protein A
MWRFAALLVVLTMLITACNGGAATEVVSDGETEGDGESEGEVVGGFEVPAIEDGMFNVAMVLIGPHDDGGWSQAHYEGLQYIEENVDNVHVAYIENVPEGADSEQIFRSLSRKGFDLIFGTSFGYMDAMEIVAEEFPDTMFIHISGYKANGTNFGNLFGAMEVMKYMAGMAAGARAQMDDNPRLGYMATFPIPEEIRLGNAIALGMLRTCPECTLDVRWINTWHDPVIEKDAAASLFDAGAQVVFTGADTPAVADVAEEKGKWGVTYDWYGSCTSPACLTAPYWIWGPVYAEITEGIIAGTYIPGWHYFDADTGGMGLYGFMDGQELTPGLADLPDEVIAEIEELLEASLNGEFTRFDVFSGPIIDNAGEVVVPEGEQMEQSDLDQFPPGAEGLECEYCMYWWSQGITSELPEL